MSSKQLIRGTIILTTAGILTRILGFGYKIFLSNRIGAKGLGIYQLVFSVYVICHTIYCSGIQTVISKETAAIGNNHKNEQVNFLFHALILSLSAALFLSGIVYASSGFIANRLLLEPECSVYIKTISFVFPFSAITCCINGYHYGLKATKIPSVCQLVEQILRITVVVIIVFTGIPSVSRSCLLAVIGLIAGEIAACIFSCFTWKNPAGYILHLSSKILMRVLPPSFLLTLNRLLINVLSTIESALIPYLLRCSGLSQSQSLSVYGTLTGMSLPVILFPTAVSLAFSIMLLPEISGAWASGSVKKVTYTTDCVIALSAITGVFSMCFFYVFGKDLGLLIYSSKSSGIYMHFLSLMSPFLYISTSFSSILNGIDKTMSILINSMISILLRIAVLILFVSDYGIMSFIYGLIASQILLCILDYFSVKRSIPVNLFIFNDLILPTLVCGILFGITKRLYTLLVHHFKPDRIYSLVIIIIMSIISSYFAIRILLINKRFNTLTSSCHLDKFLFRNNRNS